MFDVGFLVTELSDENGLRPIYNTVKDNFNACLLNIGDETPCSVYITNMPFAIDQLPGKVIYIFTDIDGGIVLGNEYSRREIRNSLAHASAIFTYSKQASEKISDYYKIKCYTELPKLPSCDSAPNDILYFNISPQIISEFPNERFVPFRNMDQMANAKLYLHRPLDIEYYNLRLLYASSYGVPAILEESYATNEIKTTGDIVLSPDADLRKWIQAIREGMRDRHLNSRNVRDGVNRYNHQSELLKKISEQIVRSPVEQPPTPKQTPTLEEKLKRMQEKRVVGGKYRVVKPQIKELPQSRKIVVNKEARRRGVVKNPPPTSIFLTGGIGDVIALEAYFPKSLRDNLETIYYATRKWEPIKNLFSVLPNYPKLRNHIPVWKDFSEFWCFLHKGDCTRHLHNTGTPHDEGYLKSPDYSIANMFSKINAGSIEYNFSSVCDYRLSTINFDLPSKYISICPYSSDKRLTSRDFDQSDWDSVLNFLTHRNISGVVLNEGNDHVPEHPLLTNLTNKTSLIQAIEVLKRSNGYIGIDSSLSVVASKCLCPDNIVVKSRNAHLYQHKHIYYAPLRDLSFVEDISSRLSQPKVFSRFLGVREITVRTVQGLGDIFWVYQKLSPYFDKINLKILVTSNDPVQRRSQDWVSLLPKIGTIGFETVPGEDYNKVARTRYSIGSVLDSWKRGEKVVTYAMNAALEAGIRIEDVDTDSLVESNVDIQSLYTHVPFNEYLLLYVSGAVKQLSPEQLGAWNIDKWVALVESMYRYFKVSLPVVVIGASFDAVAVQETVKKLGRLNVPVVDFIQSPPAQVCDIIKKAKVFLGFQSGLNIVADNFDVKQVMLYYHMLDKMRYTWCKKKNIGKEFNAFTFNNTIDEIITSLPNNFFEPKQ